MPCTGASTPASAAVLALCSIHGAAWILQPLHGHARPRHDANGYATPKYGSPKPSGSCRSAWLQQPPSVSTAAHRRCSRPKLGLTPKFASVSYRQAFPHVVSLHRLLLSSYPSGLVTPCHSQLCQVAIVIPARYVQTVSVMLCLSD